MNTKLIYKQIILRLFFLLLFFSLSRILLFFFNTSLFYNTEWTGLSVLWFYGLRFDLSTLLMLNGLFILMYIFPAPFRTNSTYIHLLDWLAISFNSIAFLINLMDIIYFRFTLRRTTFDILDFAKANNGFLDLIPQFISDFWYIPLIWFFFVAAILKIFQLTKVRFTHSIADWKFYTTQSLLFILMAGFLILGIRGGSQLKPISPINAANYGNINEIPLILNTPFTIIKTIGKEQLERKAYFSDDELASIFSPQRAYSSTNASQTKKNVVVIILESFSVEHFRFFNKNLQEGTYAGFTPFLDSLFEKSLVFNAIANGKRSIDGIPAIISSLPTLMNQSIVGSNYAGNKINSLAQILKQNGYYTAFFHGGKNGTMNFDAYAQMAGFDHYFGKDEYNNNADFDENWGIWDEKYFQYFATKLTKLQSPFFTTIFSLSSHHPYSIPKEHEGKFRTGDLPIQQSIMYTDYALQQFFETAKQMPWYTNTLFVITADHTSEGNFDFYKNSMGQYLVPIAFFSPIDTFLIKTKTRKQIQQTDIFPSIIDYLHISDPFVAFGNSIFDTIANSFGVNYTNNYTQLVKDGYLLRFSDNKTTDFFNLQTDSLLTQNVVNPKNRKQQEMERFLKAYIQQYNNRMLDNYLY